MLLAARIQFSSPELSFSIIQYDTFAFMNSTLSYVLLGVGNGHARSPAILFVPAAGA